MIKVGKCLAVDSNTLASFCLFQTFWGRGSFFLVLGRDCGGWIWIAPKKNTVNNHDDANKNGPSALLELEDLLDW